VRACEYRCLSFIKVRRKETENYVKLSSQAMILHSDLFRGRRKTIDELRARDLSMFFRFKKLVT
jgi:hypothetical protein